MPSTSLDHWQNDRILRLQKVENQCAASLSLVVPDPELSDENLRGFTILLSAHFQGYRRDLYSECTQILAAEVVPSLQALVQTQFLSNLALDRGNPNIQNIKTDFKRFDLTFNLAANPANQSPLRDLNELTEWRNIVAHQGVVHPGGFPPLSTLQAWLASCDGLATALDAIMYNRLLSLLGRKPWIT